MCAWTFVLTVYLLSHAFQHSCNKTLTITKEKNNNIQIIHHIPLTLFYVQVYVRVHVCIQLCAGVHAHTVY